ncbi:MAG TPA: FlgD immunoglobulin-like domain containing protein [Candidatus Acidoferrales bacterium]|nr:FlgD immunoglobulin-like domain containing protein [Candidatus Acidoferrales bacterium]
MKCILIFLSLIVGGAFAQPAKVGKTDAVGQIPQQSSGQVWQVPFASSDNTISLSVQNNSGTETKNVSVAFNKIPSWLKFKENAATIKSISANASGDAGFTFSVDKKAPVGKDTTLTATISTTNGQSWTKEIKISVGAPKDYKLYNNFSNPFNPSTKIAFELPKASHVELIIYDVVGREVTQAADADYPAGYTELTWNGTNKNGTLVSSGVYFYRISADKWSKVKKMMMVK